MDHCLGRVATVHKHNLKRHGEATARRHCTSTPARPLIWRTQETGGGGWWSGVLSLNMYIGCEETHHSRSYTHTHTRMRHHKHANAWQFPGELTTLDWWRRQSSICFVISLSLSHRTPSTSLFYCHCFNAACSDQSSISPALLQLLSPPPLHSSYLPHPHASHFPSIYYRQSLFRVDPLSTMGTKQMCVSNPDGMILML